jgi:Tol biopolymer transport system component
VFEQTIRPKGRRLRAHRYAVALLPLLVSLFVLPTSSFATYPGANGRITFTSFNYDNAPTRVEGVLSDGSSRGKISGTKRDDYAASWSQDGSELLVIHGHKLVLQDVATGTRHAFFSLHRRFSKSFAYLFFFWGSNPVLSPDGSSAVFCLLADRTPLIRSYVINTDGTRLHKISGDHPRCATDWSTTGRLVAAQGTHGSKILTMDPDGSHVTVVHTMPRTSGFLPTPAWSPDGGSLLVVAPAWHDPLNSEIYTMHADGSHFTRLTHTTHRAEQNAVWSPDGSMIAFSRPNTSDPQSPWDLFVMTSSGSSFLRLTHTPKVYDMVTAWEPT